MKFTKLRFVGASNVDLPIADADSSGPFVLKGAEGLGPVEVEVSYANTAEEGGVRQKRRAVNKQIIARVGLQPSWNVGQTPDELRSVLYGLLTTKYGEPVRAQIMNGNTVLAEAKGDVSKLETAIFTADPEVLVTLDCDYPYFLAPSALTQVPVRTVEGGQTRIDISNGGNAPSGFLMSLTLQSAPSGNLQLTDDSSSPAVMRLSGSWAAGDTFIVDTRPGTRGVWKIPAGTTVKTSVLGYLDGSSPWLLLHGGANRLRLNVTAFDWYDTAFVHTPAYWGV